MASLELPEGLGAPFEVEAVWFAVAPPPTRDLDNFGLKYVLDAITRTGKLWQDDDIANVRRIDSLVILVANETEERLEVRVFAARQGA